MGAFMGIYRVSIPEVPNPTDAVYHLGYGLSSTVYIPVSVFEAGATQHLWRIDSTDHIEYQGWFSAFLDRFRSLPQLDFKILGQDDNWRSEGMLRVHLGSWHLGLGSLLRLDTLSPRAEVIYRDVDNMVRISYVKGSVPRPFGSVVELQLPVHYAFPGPTEQFGWMIEASAHRDFSAFSIGAGYRHRDDWDRCGLGEAYYLVLFEGVQENAGFASLTYSHSSGIVMIKDSISVEYEKVTPDMPFVPRYRIANALRIAYRALESRIGLLYVSGRPGMYHTLPYVALMETRIGFRWSRLMVFITGYNIVDRPTVMYDHYPITPRTVAAGLEFSRP
jgi:hypothetical protein